MVRKILRLTLYTTLFFVAAAAGFALWAYHASQQEPEFYQQALSAQPEVEKQAAQALERNVEELKSELLHEDRWEAEFSQEQINGWLASQLSQRYPHVLPRQVRDPRVAIEAQKAWLGCRYNSTNFSTVVAIAMKIEMGAKPNELAVRILKASAGALPLPWKKWVQRITQVARRSRIDIRWEEDEGELVAHVAIPMDQPELKDRKLLLDRVALRDGKVYLAGRTGDEQPSLANKDDAQRRSSTTGRPMGPLALKDEQKAQQKRTRQ